MNRQLNAQQLLIIFNSYLHWKNGSASLLLRVTSVFQNPLRIKIRIYAYDEYKELYWSEP